MYREQYKIGTGENDTGKQMCVCVYILIFDNIKNVIRVQCVIQVKYTKELEPEESSQTQQQKKTCSDMPIHPIPRMKSSFQHMLGSLLKNIDIINP